MMMIMMFMMTVLVSFLTGLLGSAQALWGAHSRLRQKDAPTAFINLLCSHVAAICVTGNLSGSRACLAQHHSHAGPVVCTMHVFGAFILPLSFLRMMRVDNRAASTHDASLHHGTLVSAQTVPCHSGFFAMTPLLAAPLRSQSCHPGSVMFSGQRKTR